MRQAWLAVTLVALGTWGMRASLVVLFGRVDVPPLLGRAFRYVAPSAMAALSIPAFVAPSGAFQVSPAHLAAALAGGFVAWRFHSFLGTLVVGLGVFAALSAFATG